MVASRFPGAEWKGDGVSGGTFTGAPYRVLLHTTETRHIPGYADGKTAPHLTYSPLTRHWYQHTSLTYAARALRNEAGGVQTNRANCLQVEIICYSARRLSESVTPRGLWVGDLPDTAIGDLRKFIAWCGAEFGVKPVWPGRQALNSGQANAPGFRMTFDEWNRFNGVCGHQHVPENIHWDPAALDWGRLMATTQPPDEEEDEMTTAEFMSQLTRERVSALCDARAGGSWVINPSNNDRLKEKAYWLGLLTTPDVPAWADFHRAVLAAGQVNAALGATIGLGALQVSMTGKATPI